MNWDRLEWIIWKQLHIIKQIRFVTENKKIEILGHVPKDITPQGLINFQRERYNILEKIKKTDEPQLISWLEDAKRRLTGNPDKDYITVSEIQLLKDCLNA